MVAILSRPQRVKLNGIPIYTTEDPNQIRLYNIFQTPPVTVYWVKDKFEIFYKEMRWNY